MRLPDVVASFDGVVPHVYRLSSPYSVSCYQDVKLTSVLRYVALLRLRLRLSSALHLHLCRLPLFGLLSANVLTARCLLAAYPGIQQMVLFFPYLDSTHCPLCNVNIHFTNFC